jgi:hypothetical protein
LRRVEPPSLHRKCGRTALSAARQHVYIDGADGQFYNWDREPISAKEGLDYAMPDGQVHSHSQDLPELSIEEPGFGLSI